MSSGLCLAGWLVIEIAAQVGSRAGQAASGLADRSLPFVAENR